MPKAAVKLRDLRVTSSPDAPFIPAGRIALPGLPGLEAPRFSDLDQLSHPDQPMTRLVKDVLRVGNWHLSDGEVWHVTPETLKQLAANFTKRKQLGNEANFIWDHSDDNRNAIAPIDQMIVSGDRLWAVGYFTPDVAKDLQNPARKVSIRSASDWQDGDGTVYPGDTPLHVAVVEVPVVSGQKPFMELSRLRARQAARFLLTGKPVKDLAMDQELIDLLMEVFGALGAEMQVPADVTDVDSLKVWLSHLVAMLKPGEEPETTEPGGEGPPATPAESMPEGAAMSQQLSKAIAAATAPLMKELAALRGDVKDLKSDKTNAKKEAFESKLRDLGRAGLSGNDVQHFRSLGQRYGWDLSLLKGAEGIKGVDMNRVSKGHRDASAPAVNGSALTDEQVAEELQKRGRDPKKMPAPTRR